MSTFIVSGCRQRESLCPILSECLAQGTKMPRWRHSCATLMAQMCTPFAQILTQYKEKRGTSKHFVNFARIFLVRIP